MKNEDLLVRHGSLLNAFTRALRDLCLVNGTVLVLMRNGDYSAVRYEPPESGNHPYDDCPDGGFRGTGESMAYWLANGESQTANRYDLVEFEAPAPAEKAWTPTQDEIPRGVKGKLVTLDGEEIVSTVERLIGTVGIDSVSRKDDGSLAITYDGNGTSVDWDGQTALTNSAGEPLYETESGERYALSQLKVVAEGYNADDDEDDNED